MRRTLTFLLVLMMALAGSATHAPRPIAAQACSDEAELVEQTVDPAAEVIAPDATLTVAWTLRNSGDCTWSRSYRLIFVGGERMDGARTTRLRNSVEPGESVTFALELTAPSDEDAYSGTWRLRTADGDAFGPELTVTIQVGEDTVATTDVVLPEVLAFGGMGAGDDPDALLYCVEDGALPAQPKLVVDESSLDFRYANLYLCSFAEGAALTIEVVDPLGNSFSRSYVEDAAVVGYDVEEEIEYTGTVLQVYLTWIKQAPSGEWVVTVTSEEIEYVEEVVINVPLPLTPVDVEEYPTLDNWPTAPINPFFASEGCHYAYFPGQEMMVSGEHLPPNSTFPLGVYQDRFSNGYITEQLTVQTDDEGSFVMPYTALEEPGTYNLVILLDVSEEGYSDNGTQYDPSYGGDTAFTCISVVLEEEPEFPLRMAFAMGNLGSAEIQVYDMVAGVGYFPTYNSGLCDASEPGWWPDGEWVIYQSNCVETEGEFGPQMGAGEDYDLYGVMIDPTYTVLEEDKLIRLTATPDLHETEPDANVDGLIVYVETAVGESLDGGGELRLLDVFEETDTSLGLYGRAPAWSPDGTRIAFMSDVEGNWNIYIYDVEDEKLWLVSDGCATHCRLPAWSPNGRQIIYHAAVSMEDFTPSGLWIASVAGISRPRLYLAGEYGRPTWTSEGWIAFQGPDGIYRAPSRGNPTIQRYLANSEWATYWSPAWSH